MKINLRRALGTILGIVAAFATQSLHAQTNLIPLAPSKSQPLPGGVSSGGWLFDGDSFLVSNGQRLDAYTLLPDGSFQFDVDLLSLIPTTFQPYPFGIDTFDLEDETAILIDEGYPYYGLPGSTPGFLWVFRKVQGVWEYETAYEFEPLTRFAQGTAISGNRLAVGEPGFGHNGYTSSFRGVVNIYERSPASSSALTFTTRLGAPPGMIDDFFGQEVAMDGDTVVSSSRRGCLFVHRYSQSTDWVPSQILFHDGTVTDVSSPPSTFEPNTFGWWMEVHDDTIFVTDIRDAQGNLQDPQVLVFRETNPDSVPSSFTYRGALTPSDGAPGPMPAPSTSLFGQHLAASDDWLFVSAPWEQQNNGAVYAYRRDSSVPVGWREFAKYVVSEDFFGGLVEFSGRRFVASAWESANMESRFYLEDFLPVASEPELQGFCHADGGDQQGCQDCPCGNNLNRAAAGGCRNSAGIGARLAVTGRPSLSNDTLRLEVGGAIPNSYALLFSGAARAPVFPGAPCPAGSGILSPVLDGLLCVQTDQRRLNPRAVDADGFVGVTNAAWGFGSQSLLVQGGLTPGQTRHFQVVYRDGGTAACGTQTNTTNGITILVQL